MTNIMRGSNNFILDMFRREYIEPSVLSLSSDYSIRTIPDEYLSTSMVVIDTAEI